MAKGRPRYWKSLPKEDKKGIVRALLEAGYTCEAIGRALGTTKNAVVGYQHQQLSELTGRVRGTLDAVPRDVLAALLLQEWPREDAPPAGPAKASPKPPEPKVREPVKPALPERRGILSDPPTRPKLTTDDTLMCTHVDPDSRKRCAYLFENEVTKRCRLHPL